MGHVVTRATWRANDDEKPADAAFTSPAEHRPDDGVAPVDVVVAIPAHDEEALVASCLASVVRAVAHARRERVVDAARILLAAHRCSDGTAARARAALAEPGSAAARLLDAAVMDTYATAQLLIVDGLARAEESRAEGGRR